MACLFDGHCILCSIIAMLVCKKLNISWIAELRLGLPPLIKFDIFETAKLRLELPPLVKLDVFEIAKFRQELPPFV